MKKQKIGILKLIFEILVSMRKFEDPYPFCVDQGLQLEPENHYFLFCNGFLDNHKKSHITLINDEI